MADVVVHSSHVASRVIFMADGNIVEDDSPEEVFGNPKSTRLQDFLSKVCSRFGLANPHAPRGAA